METNYLPNDDFQQTVGVRVDQQVLAKLLRIVLPNLMDHFDKCQFEIGSVTLTWLSCLFAF